MKKLALGIAMSSVLAAGVARAQADIALEHEAELDRMRMDAIRGGRSILDIETDSTVLYKHDADGRKVAMDPTLGLPYDESHRLKQGDVYASAADLISPLPDRLSVNPDSPFYGEYGKVGVRFDGSDRPGDVEEYCVSEGWIRVRTFMANGKPKRERGRHVCLKRYGTVEPYRK